MSKMRCKLAEKTRRGSALLMLVLALALLISVFSASMVKQSQQERRTEREHDVITYLENAINAVSETQPSGTNSFRLPVDELKNQWIEVTQNNKDVAKQVFTAKLVRDGIEVLTIQRKLQSPN